VLIEKEVALDRVLQAVGAFGFELIALEKSGCQDMKRNNDCMMKSGGGIPRTTAGPVSGPLFEAPIHRTGKWTFK